MIKQKSNLLSMIFPFLVFYMAPLVFCINGMFYNPANTGYILLFLLPWSYLFFEATVNDYATYFITKDVIILTKPWRKWSLFAGKRNHQLVIQPEEWDSLFYKKINNRNGSSVQFYFRKDQNIAFYFSTTGLQKSVDLIQQAFPEKHYVSYGDLFPRKLIKQLRKTYPERVV